VEAGLTGFLDQRRRVAGRDSGPRQAHSRRRSIGATIRQGGTGRNARKYYSQNCVQQPNHSKNLRVSYICNNPVDICQLAKSTGNFYHRRRSATSSDQYWRHR
jgi:hypothetical protein